MSEPLGNRVDMPFLTAGVAGTGGEIRSRLEDFAVEEIPLYPASGNGTHIYMTVRKKGISTHRLIEELAKRLEKKTGDIGYAGLKDTHAVATQRLSVEHVTEEAIRELDMPGAEVLNVERHTNKLKPGHLAGNRFIITIRGARPDSVRDAQKVIDILERRGMPNHFGEQRFGRYLSNHIAGKALVLGDAEAFLQAVILPPGWEGMEAEAVDARRAFIEGRYPDALRMLPAYLREERKLLDGPARTGDASRALHALAPRMRVFYMNAYQSYLFNRLAARRGMERIDILLEGDLAYIHSKGAVFSVTEPGKEMERAARGEVSPSGPLYGRKTPLASGEPGKMERELLAEEGISMELFSAKHLRRLTGERRPLRVPVTIDAAVEEPEPGILIIKFSLPAGSYATNVIREVIKKPTVLPSSNTPV